MAKGHDTFLHMRVAASIKRLLDDLRKDEADLPSQAEMVRRLIERASNKRMKT